MRRKGILRFLSAALSLALCAVVLPISAAAAVAADARSITYTVRIDGDNLKKTFVSDFVGERDRNQGISDSVPLYNQMMMPGLNLQTTIGLIQVMDFPDFDGFQITRATFHMNSSEVEKKTLNLHPITSAWDPSTVTWNTQPSINNARRFSYLSGAITDYDFEITDQAQAWANGNCYGLAVKLDTPREMTYAGSAQDYIEIEYTAKKTLRIDENSFECTTISDYPMYQDYHYQLGTMELWDNGFVPGALYMTQYGLMKTMLPDIGNNTVLKATLHFKYPNASDETYSIAIKEITSAWDAHSVTWKTKPAYNNTPVAMSQADSSGYTFDITPLMKTWYSGENNGMLVALVANGKYLTLKDSGAYIDIEYAKL